MIERILTPEHLRMLASMTMGIRKRFDIALKEVLMDMQCRATFDLHYMDPREGMEAFSIRVSVDRMPMEVLKYFDARGEFPLQCKMCGRPNLRDESWPKDAAGNVLCIVCRDESAPPETDDAIQGPA